MNNQQQQNFYGNQQQQQFTEQWMQWQQWQYQQASYQQPFIPPQPVQSDSSQFSVPPPPPPESEQPSTSAQFNARNTNVKNKNKNFNQSSNNNRGQNTNQNNNGNKNFRGNQRGRGGGGASGGNQRFSGNDHNSFKNNKFKNNSGNSSDNNAGGGNPNESHAQRAGNFNNIRGKVKNNWNKNSRKNPLQGGTPGNVGGRGGGANQQQQQQTSSSRNVSFGHQAVNHALENDPQISVQRPDEPTQEDIAFEKMFKEWESQFQEWKDQNKNHPDKEQYQKYERQFMEVREKLLSRREEMRRKKLVTNPVKTAEQLAFENQWNSASKAQSENSKKPTQIETTIFDPKPSPSQLPPPEINMGMSASSILFGNQSKVNDVAAPFFDDDLPEFESFDDSSTSCPKNFEDKHTIPGLEIKPVEKAVSESDLPEKDNDVIDLDQDEDNEFVQEFESRSEQQDALSPKPNSLDTRVEPRKNVPIPRFRPRVQRNIIDIDDLLYEPRRSIRHGKIMILIRGAPGSGKHYIAQLIYDKECEMGNDRCKILSIDRYVVGTYDASQAEKCNQTLFAESRNLVREGYINFAIVILNGCTLQQFNKISHTAFSLGGYQCFSIEIHQKREVCEANNIRKRSPGDIINEIEDLDRYPTPQKITVIDPSSLLRPNVREPSSNTTPSQSAATSSSDQSNLSDFAQKMAKILQDQNVMGILQAQLNNVPQPQPQIPQLMGTHSIGNYPQMPLQQQQQQQQQQQFFSNSKESQFQQRLVHESNFDNIPIFKPNKIIDYDHEHIPTFEEKLLEFKIFRVIEYHHRETPKLREFVKDIDLDKIIEKRKAVALRKKILEYLRSAEKPEDTVSNPKYPKNWEVIEQERPPRRNKRRKIITPKIKRILLQKSREEINVDWMTKGYSDRPSHDDQMDLEEISSEDDDDMGSPPKKPTPAPVQEFVDEYKDVPKTTPDFNHFNHSNVMDIKKILLMPDRKKRPQKILIITRGASGSGKSHLVQMIKRKESEAGRDASDVRILSIDDYFLTEDDEEQSGEAQAQLVKSYLDEMYRHLKKTINEGLYKFIIVDAENCDLTSYMEFYKIGTSMNFTVFTIELYQTLEICVKQCKRSSRSSSDIQNAIDLLSRNRIPQEHTLLIPSFLYADYKCFINPAVSSESGISSKQQGDEVDVRQRSKLVQIINDKCLSIMPQFNWHSREIIDIDEIVEEPGRYNRNQYIAILLRGPGGSGKDELASMILEKERLFCNESAQYISIEEYFINPLTQKYEFNTRLLDDNIQKLLKNLRDIMRVKSHKFLIIDPETGDFTHYKQVHDLVSSYQYQCYTIELYQDPVVCEENDEHHRPISEIEAVLEDMQLNPTPDDHILLNAAAFYKHTTNSSDRPLKSALKISPNTSINKNVDISKAYNEFLSKLSIQSKYQAIFNQRMKVNGEFVSRNENRPSKLPEFNWFNQDITDIHEILEEPNRTKRPPKIAIFLRGCPGSGKTYLSRLIERKEIEKLGHENKVKLLSIDCFYEAEQYRKVGNEYEKYIEVDLDSSKSDEYMRQLNDAFKTIIEKKEHQFLIIDGGFCDLTSYNQMWSFAKKNDFSCYTIQLNQDDAICLKYNDHRWDESIVRSNNKLMEEVAIPDDHPLLDPESLYHEYRYNFEPKGNLFSANESMDISDVSDDEKSFSNDDEDDDTFETKFGKFKMSAVASKWDDVETPDINRLDGTMKKSERFTMKDYLQSDEWSMRPSVSGKKRVRWADIEEKKAQERMRSIGFIVGMTDWNRMTDESDGKSALEKTKYIESRKK